MPRTYGTTNVMPYAAAPAVGQVGDEYYNTASKALFLSDGTQWNLISGGGGAYVLVTLTAPTVAGSPYLVTHNLNTTTVMVQIFDAVTGNAVNAQVHILNANQVQVSVAANMPNNVNVIVGGASPAPGQLSNFAYTQTLPAPTTAGSPYTVTHNLNTVTPVVQLWDQVTGQQVMAQIRAPSVNTIQVSVTQNMPNIITVVVVGSAAALAPIAPSNYATQSYVDTHNVPPPVTSGSGIQSFTDAQGMVWVAATGVNSGAWRLARDVLHCKVQRNAAWTAGTSATQVTMDTIIWDSYGMMGSGGIILPITGMYRIGGTAGVTSTAIGQWIAFNLWVGSTNVVIANNQSGQASTNTLQALGSDTAWSGTPGALLKVNVACLGAYAGQTGLITSLSASYLGTG
jgi:hypothetical protein